MRLFFWIMLFAGSLTHAALEWEQKEIQIEAAITQTSAQAIFNFSNTGQAPVSIANVKVSCGCLSTKLTKRMYAPGEKGELSVTFDLRNRTGKQRKGLEVTADDESVTQLFVEANIPEMYSCEPNRIVWSKNDRKKSKISHLVNPNTVPVRLLSATSSNPDFPVELHVIREGFEYEVVVSRLGVVSNARSVVRITTEAAPAQKESKQLKLYVHAK